MTKHEKAKIDNAQLKKFQDAAREVEADDDEKRFDERLARVARPAKKTLPPKAVKDAR